MKKNIIRFIGGIIIFDIGLELFHLSLSPSILEMSWLTSITMAIVLYFLGIFFILLGIGNIVLGLKAFWKWYRYIPNPFTLEERRAISSINSLLEGNSRLNKRKRKELSKNLLSSRTIEILKVRFGYGQISLSSEFRLPDQLLISIDKLSLRDQRTRINKHGEFTRSSWLATRQLYWDNRGFPVKKE